MVEKLGRFICTSGTLMVTDPCYKKEGCTNLVEATPGNWEVQVEYASGLIKSICVAIGNNYFRDTEDMVGYAMYQLPFRVSVDSGQCIIADYSQFTGTDSEYNEICFITDGSDAGGVIGNYGAVSATGYGDGSYSAYARYNRNGKATCVVVVFMEDDNNDE